MIEDLLATCQWLSLLKIDLDLDFELTMNRSVFNHKIVFPWVNPQLKG